MVTLRKSFETKEVECRKREEPGCWLSTPLLEPEYGKDNETEFNECFLSSNSLMAKSVVLKPTFTICPACSGKSESLNPNCVSDLPAVSLSPTSVDF